MSMCLQKIKNDFQTCGKSFLIFKTHFLHIGKWIFYFESILQACQEASIQFLEGFPTCRK